MWLSFGLISFFLGMSLGSSAWSKWIPIPYPNSLYPEGTKWREFTPLKKFEFFSWHFCWTEKSEFENVTMLRQNQMILAFWWGRSRECSDRSWWILRRRCIWERYGSQILGAEDFPRFLSFRESTNERVENAKIKEERKGRSRRKKERKCIYQGEMGGHHI